MPARARVASASIVGIGPYGAFGMTSIERTAYPRFKRLITARELHLFFSPGLEEALWAAERTESDEHQLALLLMLKSYQRMGCFPKLGEVPDMVVDSSRPTARWTTWPPRCAPRSTPRSARASGERTSEAERSGLLLLLDVEDLGPGGKSLFNRLKQPAQRATWSHFRNQKNHLEWVDGLGDTGAWRGCAHNGTATGDSGLSPRVLAPAAVPMWADRAEHDFVTVWLLWVR